MEDVLDVYKRPRDPDRPLVCLDEASRQLTRDMRTALPMKPGRVKRIDYEYQRNGTANPFMFFAPLEGWRRVKVTDRRTAIDYAHALRELADVQFPKAAKIVLVQDNLNTHKPASLHEAFPPAKARRLAERFEWHYTPKHGSWLNMAETNSPSCRVNVWIVAYQTNQLWIQRPGRGKNIATLTTPRRTGTSQRKTPESNSSVHTP